MLPYCHILSYCLMPNHFHIQIFTKSDLKNQKLNNSIGNMLSSYTQAINKQENRTGSLFQQNTKAICLAENKDNSDSANNEYPFICFNYIHQNPMKAGLVKKMEDWEFSSFKDYFSMRSITICNIELAAQLLDLPKSKQDFYEMSYKVIDDDKLKGIF